MIQFKELTINTDEKLCYIDGKAVKMPKSEYNVLVFLLTHKNKVFSREELIELAWPEHVSTRAVSTAISRLRKKLGDYSKYVVSRNGFGYGFIEMAE